LTVEIVFIYRKIYRKINTSQYSCFVSFLEKAIFSVELITKILDLETRSFVVVFVVNLPKLHPIKKYQSISDSIKSIAFN